MSLKGINWSRKRKLLRSNDEIFTAGISGVASTQRSNEQKQPCGLNTQMKKPAPKTQQDEEGGPLWSQIRVWHLKMEKRFGLTFLIFRTRI